MAINSLYPGFVKIFYTSNGHQHTQTLPVKPYVGLGGAWYLEQKNDVTGIQFSAAVTVYANLFKALLHTTSTVTSAELWTMSSPTADPQFREVVEVATAGTATGTVIPYSQVSVTYRTANGGLFRHLVLEQSIHAVNAEMYPPFSAATAAMRAWLTGDQSFVFGRDGGALVAAIRLLSKTNDQLRKRYLLDA